MKQEIKTDGLVLEEAFAACRQLTSRDKRSHGIFKTGMKKGWRDLYSVRPIKPGDNFVCYSAHPNGFCSWDTDTWED